MKNQNHSYGDLSVMGEVRLVRLLPGPIERIWAYLTDPEKRGQWLAKGPTDLRVGGLVKLEFYNSHLSSPGEEIPEKHREHAQDGCSFTGKVLRFEPPHFYSHTWGGADGSASEVTFELTPQGDKVQLVLTHRKLGEERGEILSVSAGWHTHLAILVGLLEGTEPPSFWATHTRLEKEYEELLNSLERKTP